MANLTDEERGIIEKLKTGRSALREKAKEALDNIFGRDTFKPLGGVTGVDAEYRLALESQIKMMQGIGEAGRQAADGASLLENASFELFTTIENGRAAAEALTAEMRSFAFMTKEIQAELGTATMVLNEFGVDMRTTGEILDSAAMAFGMSQEKLAKLSTELATVVYRFPGQAADIARNFKNAQSSLAYDSSKIMDVFKKLQYTSSVTGVEFSKLTSVFGDQMDTFESSATKAGSLNAILGRSVFNSIDLLGKTEAERVDTIVKGVRSSIGGDVNRLGKFQLKAVAEGMGLSVEDTRRLLSGQATPEGVLKDKGGDPRMKLQQQANKALNENTMSLEALITEFKTYRSPAENQARLASARMRELIKSELEAKLQKFEVVAAPLSLAAAAEDLVNFATLGKEAAEMSRLDLVNLRRDMRDGMVREEKRLEAFASSVVTGITSIGTSIVNGVKAAFPKGSATAGGGNTGSTGGTGNTGGTGGTGGNTGQETYTPPNNPVEPPTTVVDEIKKFFNGSGKMTVEVTGLTGTTLQGLLKTVPAPTD